MFVISNERKKGESFKTGEPYDYVAVRGLKVCRDKEGKTYLDSDKANIYPLNGSYDGVFIPPVGSFVIATKEAGLIPSPPGFDDQYVPALLEELLKRVSK